MHGEFRSSLRVLLIIQAYSFAWLWQCGIQMHACGDGARAFGQHMVQLRSCQAMDELNSIGGTHGDS
jgi:hypothetical protein